MASRQLWLQHPCEECNRLTESAFLWKKMRLLARELSVIFLSEEEHKPSQWNNDERHLHRASWYLPLFLYYLGFYIIFLTPRERKTNCGLILLDCATLQISWSGKKNPWVTSINCLGTHEASSWFSSCVWPLSFSISEWDKLILFHFTKHKGKRKESSLYF